MIKTAGLYVKMPEVMLKAAGIVLMHSRGVLSGVNAGEEVIYEDIFHEIKEFFKERTSLLKNFGISENKIVLDPGIGFGKGLKDSLR